MHKRWKEYWVSMDEVRKEKEIKKIVTHRANDLAIILDKAPQPVSQTKELLYLMNILRNWPVPDSICFLGIHPNLPITNDVTQVFDCRHFELALLGLEIQLIVFEDAHYLLDNFTVTVLVSREDENVV